jgi:hypothetical protein
LSTYFWTTSLIYIYIYIAKICYCELHVRASCQMNAGTPDVAKICHRKRRRRCRVALSLRGRALAYSRKPQYESSRLRNSLITRFDRFCYPPLCTGVNCCALLQEVCTFLVLYLEGLRSPRLLPQTLRSNIYIYIYICVCVCVCKRAAKTISCQTLLEEL